MMAFLNLRSNQARARSSSPLPDADDTADLLDQLRILEREADREEDGSFSLVGGDSGDGSRTRAEGVRSASSGYPHRLVGAVAGSGGGGEYNFDTPLRQGASRMIQSGGGV